MNLNQKGIVSQFQSKGKYNEKEIIKRKKKRTKILPSSERFNFFYRCPHLNTAIWKRIPLKASIPMSHWLPHVFQVLNHCLP